MRKGLHKMYSKPLPHLTSGEQRLELPLNIALPDHAAPVGPRHADRARLRGQRKARGPQKVRGSFLTV
jgi:hypothetical protein